ncbi:zinc finger, CCHC-type containing protein [Tanacetum coccineum]
MNKRRSRPRFVENEFPAIVFDDVFTSEVTPSYELTVSPLNDNKIDCRISFDESDDEDYTLIHDENLFSYKIIYVGNLKMDSVNNNDKVNMPSFPSPEPEVSYFNDLDFFKDFENEFLAIVYNDALTSKSNFLIEPTDLAETMIWDAIFDENRFSSVSRPSQRSLVNRAEDFGGLVVPKKVTEEDDPKIFDEEMKSHDVAFWKEEINYEINSIMGNNTWVLLIYLQGFRQKSRIDYFDTYASVVRLGTIRLLIAMTSIHNLIIHQMDVKTDGCEDNSLDEVLLFNGYLLNQADKCVYSKFDKTDKGVIICVYVDVMLIFDIDHVQIKHESNRITISQSHYIEKVLKKFNYFDCTSVSTLMDISEKLMPNNGQAVSQLEYSRMIGCLMYAMTCTRHDIAFVVGKLSMYTSNPNTQYWQAIQRVLKYLKKTMKYRLTYTGYPSVLEGYTDANWIRNTKDNSSTSASAGKEAEWLRNLILEIPLWSKLIAPISIRCDSAVTLEKAYSQMYNGKSRHLGIRWVKGFNS